MSDKLEIFWPMEGSSEHAVLALWCAEKIFDNPSPQSFGNCATMGVIKGDKLIAVVVFHNWQPEADVIEMSGAAIDPIWLSKRVLLEMYGYIFDVAKCQMVIQRQSVNNERINRILRRFGYDEIRLPRMRGRDEDEFLFTLTEEKWRENMEKRLKHGRKIKRTVAA